MVRTKEWVLLREDLKMPMWKCPDAGIVHFDSKSLRGHKTKGEWTKVYNNNTNKENRFLSEHTNPLFRKHI